MAESVCAYTVYDIEKLEDFSAGTLKAALQFHTDLRSQKVAIGNPDALGELLQRTRKLSLAVAAGKELLDAHGALFRVIGRNQSKMPKTFLDEYEAEFHKAGAEDGYGKRFIDAVKVLEEEK